MKVYDKVQKLQGTSNENSSSFSFTDLAEKRKSLTTKVLLHYFFLVNIDPDLALLD